MAQDQEIVQQLLETAERIEAVRTTELQALLRRAAADIEALRRLAGIRDVVWLENDAPDGRG